jgi:hypothetical protein
LNLISDGSEKSASRSGWHSGEARAPGIHRIGSRVQFLCYKHVLVLVSCKKKYVEYSYLAFLAYFHYVTGKHILMVWYMSEYVPHNFWKTDGFSWQ